MPPSTFVKAWSPTNQFLKRENVTVWQAVCPANYVSLGNVITVITLHHHKNLTLTLGGSLIGTLGRGRLDARFNFVFLELS